MNDQTEPAVPGGDASASMEDDLPFQEEHQAGYYRGKPGIPDVILRPTARYSTVRTAESREFFRVTGHHVHNPVSWHRIVRVDGRLYLIAQPTVVPDSLRLRVGGPPADTIFVETELHPADIIRVDGVDHCVVSWPLHDPVLEPLPFYGDLVSFQDRGQQVTGKILMVTPGERGSTAVIEADEVSSGPLTTSRAHVRLVGAITLVACDVMRISFASKTLLPVTHSRMNYLAEFGGPPDA